MAGMPVTPAKPMPLIGSLSANPASVLAGATVTLTAANVAESSCSATISNVAFYVESNGVPGLQIGSDTLIGGGTQSGAAWSLPASTTGLTPGMYTYYAVATDSAAVSSAVASTTLTVLAPGPLNDMFASATVISGSTASATGTNVGATKESGEPNIAGNTGGASVWYNWTAPASGLTSLTTAGSTFDTLLGVYTGGTVSGLALVASNDDASYYTLTSSVMFNAVAGVTYHIAVDGYNAASGTVKLSLSQVLAPANDMFANATALPSGATAWAGSNVGATRQSGEPLIAGTPGGASVWFTWVAPTSGVVHMDTHGSSFDTTLAVYTGSSITGLTTIAANDDDPAGGTLTSALTFNAVAGTVYHFAIDGYAGASGNIVLNVL
ncbi:MAG: PPC domain-containing protein, partial [Phycisphaerae bacterium]|nr:PPC domain-containing protein [Phycisphaerae bacterium]